MNYTGKGCSNFDPAEERRKIKKGKLPKPPFKKRKLRGKCPVCGLEAK